MNGGKEPALKRLGDWKGQGRGDSTPFRRSLSGRGKTFNMTYVHVLRTDRRSLWLTSVGERGVRKNRGMT